MPLIEQLIYEQATQECRAAITPGKSKGLQDWSKVCRELGGPLTNAGLAAAILQVQKCTDMAELKLCYNRGKPGHLKRTVEPLLKGEHQDCALSVENDIIGLALVVQSGTFEAGSCSQDSLKQ